MGGGGIRPPPLFFLKLIEDALHSMHVEQKCLKRSNNVIIRDFMCIFRKATYSWWGGADSASSLKIAFVMQIFPKNSHRGSLRHLHAWCKKNICKKVHICTKWKLQKLFYVPAPYSWWGGGGFCQVNQLFLMSPFFAHFSIFPVTFFKNILFASCMYELRAYSVKKFCQKMHGKCVF